MIALSGGERVQLESIVAALGVHEHLCTIHETTQQGDASVVPFLRPALERGEKCLLVADEERALHLLDADGLDVSRYLQTGALSAFQQREMYLGQGRFGPGKFDPDAVIAFLASEVDNALTQGFSRVRLLGEMSWVLRVNLDKDRLFEYESKLNRLVGSKPISIMCQYDRRIFAPEVVIGVIRTHPLVVYGAQVSRNPYYVPPDEFLRPDHPWRELERLLENIRIRNEEEEQLRAIGARFRAVLMNAPLGIVVLSGEGRILEANPAYCQLTGYSEEELRYMSIQDLTYKDDYPAYEELVRRLIRRELPSFVLEQRCLTKTGKVLWDARTVTVAALGNPEREQQYLIAIVQDITDRKQIELERERLAAVVQNSTDFIGISSLDLNVLFVNKAGLRLVGLRTLAEAQKTKATDYFLPEDAEYVRTVVLPTIRDKGTWSGELRFRHFQTGEAIPIFIYDSFIIGDPQTGQPMNFATVIRDIREEKRVQLEIQNSYNDLRALSARLETIREDERRRLAREIHDELGQALTAIKLEFNSLMQSLAPANRDSAKSESINRLINATIDSVRRISTELRPRILDDLGIVAALEWLAEDFELRTGVRIHTKLAEDVPLDPERATALFRIAQEALTNIARHARAENVYITLERDAEGVSLEISDDGIGIPEQLTPGAGSLGVLGMQERANLIGAQFRIAARPGTGTSVVVRVPLTPAPGGS